eukprot:TRINITY_DN71769_c0_g1_i1.p2 TRINITY_DN71769_c0_g1~~TRINITY_DN71769_c0_g1_i1.p2  ORF type:complete len:338 (+),score=77.60 TRINITY_DN71769_c0_g1_i1:77-1015(+)
MLAPSGAMRPGHEVPQLQYPLRPGGQTQAEQPTETGGAAPRRRLRRRFVDRRQFLCCDLLRLVIAYLPDDDLLPCRLVSTQWAAQNAAGWATVAAALRERKEQLRAQANRAMAEGAGTIALSVGIGLGALVLLAAGTGVFVATEASAGDLAAYAVGVPAVVAGRVGAEAGLAHAMLLGSEGARILGEPEGHREALAAARSAALASIRAGGEHAAPQRIHTDLRDAMVGMVERGRAADPSDADAPRRPRRRLLRPLQRCSAASPPPEASCSRSPASWSLGEMGFPEEEAAAALAATGGDAAAAVALLCDAARQ